MDRATYTTDPWPLPQVPYLVCPIAYSPLLERMTMDCEPSLLFRQMEYNLPFQVISLVVVELFVFCQTLRTWKSLLTSKETLTIFPFFVHTFWMSLFASIIGPFGGFFASGFKRAFKIKDFGDLIPGHGGIMDR